MLRNRGARVKLFFLISFLMVPALAMAQDESGDRNADCAAALAAPPFVDILTRNEGHDFHKISAQKSGRALVGLECSVDELTEFFEHAGWEFRGYEEWSLAGPSGGKMAFPNFIPMPQQDFASNDQRFSEDLVSDADHSLQFIFTKDELSTYKLV